MHHRGRAAAKLPAGLLAGLAMGLICVGSPALARDPFNMANPTAGEMALLPEYCPYTTGYYRGGPDRALWLARLGPTLNHVHHYCWAILKVNRALSSSFAPQLRNNLISSSILEIQYVLNNGEPDFVLLPELLYRAGTFHALIGELPQAIDFFERSRTAKADYWPPYVELAKVNLGLGRRQKAIETLRAGLEVMPSEQALLDALKRVEGTPSTSRPGASSAGQ